MVTDTASYDSNILSVCMPRRVDEAVLASIRRELLTSGAERAWALDFSGTVHIHYGALGDFAAWLRRVRSQLQPVLLVGLTPYCQEIVNLALRTVDWDILVAGRDARQDREKVAG